MAYPMPLLVPGIQKLLKPLYDLLFICGSDLVAMIGPCQGSHPRISLEIGNSNLGCRIFFFRENQTPGLVEREENLYKKSPTD